MKAFHQRILERLMELKVPPERMAPFIQLPEPALKQLAEAIDETAYPFDQWIDALLYFGQWLPKDAKYALSEQIDYLACCAEGTVQSGTLLPLKDVLENYLNAHGVERL